VNDASRFAAPAAGVGVALLGGIAAFLVSWLMKPSPVGPGADTAYVIESPLEVPLVTAVTVLTGLLACFVALLVSEALSPPDVPVQSPHPAEPPAVVTPPQPPDPRLAQRDKAVRELAELVGRLPPEYAWQAANVLRSAGVQQILADGQAFDPAIHSAVGTEPTSEAALHDVVARTVKPGWADRERVVVPARVVVYVDASQPEVLP
jgi:hypothetical protein